MKRALVVMVAVAAIAPGRGAESSLARAEAFYQRGVQAEAQSDAEFRQWARTVRVAHLDRYVDRWVYALDMYTNCLYLNPAHQKAHERLGLIYAEGWGTHANDYMALIHLTAALALDPQSYRAERLKELADRSLRRVSASFASQRLGAEGGYAIFLALARELEGGGAQAGAEGEAGTQGGGMPGTATGPPAGGPGMMMGGPGGDTGGGMGQQATPEQPERPEPRDPVRRLEDTLRNLREFEVQAGEENAMHAVRVAQAALAGSANHVSGHLCTIALMHRLMHYWDRRGVAFDPRLPEALIGECLLQMRRFFTRGKTADLAQVRAEYGRYAALGTVTGDDLWTERDTTTSLPEFLLAAARLEPDKVDEEYWKAAAGSMAINMPPGGHSEFLDLSQATMDVADMAIYEWRNWRNIAFQGIDRVYGLGRPEDVFLRDYQRLGTGELSVWPMGPLSALRQRAGG